MYGRARFILFSLQRRNHSVDLNSKHVHPFKQTLSKSGVVNSLLSNIIYQDDDILVLNKPAGVAKSPHTFNPDVSSYTAPVYMDEILQQVSQVVPKYEEIQIAKFPERYSSGIMILTTSNKSLLKVKKCIRRAKSSIEMGESYLGISQGLPISTRNSCQLAIRLAENGVTKRKVPVMEDKWSQWDMKKQRVKVLRIAHEVLSKSSLASLTRVSASATASNALRLYFATKLLSPLLGDYIFSGRVKDVMGVPLLLDPWSDVANAPKRLSPHLLKELQLGINDSSLVPLCVHLEQIVLPGYRKKQDLILRAPVPETFAWVCQQLSLELGEERNMEEDPSANISNQSRADTG